MNRLNEAQHQFIHMHIKRSAKDIWQEELIRLRGIELGEEMTLDDIETTINQWVLVETKDGGLGLRPYKCLCGKSIRYQFIVRHRTKDITYKLGSECIKNYTGIDGRVAKKVLVEHKAVNHQIDEILAKLDEGVIHVQQYLLDEESLPKLIREQLSLGLPLTDRQLTGVFRLLDKNRNKMKPRSKIPYEILKTLKEQELEYINGLEPDDRRELVVKLTDGTKVYTLDELRSITPSLIATREESIRSEGILTSTSKADIRQSQELNRVKQALHMLTEEQKLFWGTRMSLKQRIETAPYILEGSHIIDPKRIQGKMIDKKIRHQMRLGLPLTDKQLIEIEHLLKAAEISLNI